MREENPQADSSKVAIILTAAKKRFEHFGLAKTTMNEIAADIGMSKASLYYYFPDKDHLFIAVLDGEMAEFVTAIETMITRPVKAVTRLKNYANLRTAYFKQFLNLGKLESTSIETLLNPAHDAFKAKFFEAEKNLVRKIIQMGIADGEFSKISIDAHAELLVKSLTGFRLLSIKNKSYSLSPRDYEELDRYNSLFLEIFIKAISK